jgi:hypothetical protein
MTSAPEAKRRLLALLQGYAGLTGTTVRYGRPTREGQIGDRRQMVWLGPIAEGDIEWGALGRNRQDETYTIEVGAWVSKPGDDEEGTEQACAVLLSAITAAVRSDPRLGAFLKEGMTLTGGSIDTQPVGESPGWVSLATLRVACEATVVS